MICTRHPARSDIAIDPTTVAALLDDLFDHIFTIRL